MAPVPPSSALESAGTAFLTALQDYKGVMNIAALSITSKHVTLNAAIDRAHGFVPFKESLLHKDRVLVKEGLYCLPACEAQNAKREEHRLKRTGKAYKSSTTVNKSEGESAFDGLPDLESLTDAEMEVDLAVSNASSSGSVPESYAGTVPSGLHFSKTKPLPPSDTAKVDKPPVCLFYGSDVHAEADCSLNAKVREVRDKEAKDTAARADYKKREVIILDDPITILLPPKKSSSTEKAEEVKEAKEARRKHKVVLLAFSQVPGLILDFTQAEAKAATKKAEVEVVETPTSGSRKCRRSSRHAANTDTEQDYAIPRTQPSPGLTTDVSLGILDQAEAILVATDLDGCDAESAKLRERFLRRQLYVCGYSLRHFFTMHGYLEKELTHLHMEIDQDTEMADDESCAGTYISMFHASDFMFLGTLVHPCRSIYLVICQLRLLNAVDWAIIDDPDLDLLRSGVFNPTKMVPFPTNELKQFTLAMLEDNRLGFGPLLIVRASPKLPVVTVFVLVFRASGTLLAVVVTIASGTRSMTALGSTRPASMHSYTPISSLLKLHTELKSLLFGTNVTGIVIARLQQLTPGHGGLQSSASYLLLTN
ncbi:hypothetical protein DFH08DRAFT_815664 [Mycena albidolilacea]|uniref:Uncharacterized protein n=1 Tax=Mycena albidolilacea TaxID=1033008 RepID=A0AAD6ZMM1_9AGAR|nr:hypothetical protein DFH08DRAFT_815664 [Mycena albidolilacea]